MTVMKPCPFCGGTDLEVYEYAEIPEEIRSIVYYVACTDANCTRMRSDVEQAVLAWNKRG